jgi:hypothetical protein
MATKTTATITTAKKTTPRRGRRSQEEPNVHTSAFCRDLTAAVVRVLERLDAKNPDYHQQSVFFRDAVFREIEGRIDWDEVRRRMIPKR